MSKIKLPPKHTLKAQWAPIFYKPMIGSHDGFTVAVAAISSSGETIVSCANRLDRLHCFFSSSADTHISFITLVIDCLRRDLRDKEQDFLSGNFDLGSNMVLGPLRSGSGFKLSDIANAWLNKISLLHENPQSGALALVDLSSEPTALQQRESRVLPAIRDEIADINPRLLVNFNAKFHPKDRKTPVRLGYRGDKIVADFDRVPSRNIKPTLERIRSKLWLLAEHKHQTRHEKHRSHEMIVIPSRHFDPIGGMQQISFVESACADIQSEADTQNIRFRRFDTTSEAARHIFTMEERGRPLYLT